MGHSLPNGKPQTLEWFKQNEHAISTIVDVGAGSGTYIKLIKEDAKCCSHARWIGIEAWTPYIQEFELEKRYDHVINADVRTVDWTSLSPSVVIAGDVLEHMSKQDAIKLVEQILSVANTLIVSIPIRYMPQEDINGNPFEIHVKDDWTHEEIVDTWGSYIKQSYRKSVKSKLGVYWLSR